MSRSFWTAAQIKILHDRYPHERTENLIEAIGRDLRSIYAKAAELGISKSAEYLASPAAGRTNGLQGINTRFKPGNSSWNKGKKGLDLAGERGRATQFKPGAMPHNWNPVGHERITKDGILQRKMQDTGCTRRDYVPVHVLLWMQHNGPVPENHIVIFKDKNRKNISIENLECISRKENMRRNSYHNNYPKEIGRLIQLRGALKAQINRRIKNERTATK